MRTRLRRVVVVIGTAAVLVGVLGVLVLVGTAIPTRPTIAVAIAGAALVLGLTAYRPVLVPLVAVPCALIVLRVPAIPGGGVSTADVVTFAAFWPAVFLATKRYTEPMRTIIWLAVFYQAMTLFAVVANPYRANVIDWFHTLFLVVGSLAVGWAVAREGAARTGLTLLLLTGSVLAVSTIAQGLLQYAGGDLSPVFTQWPFPMHKNFVGTTLSLVATIAFAHPRWLHWSHRSTSVVFWLSTVGVLMTQSRQGLIGLGAAVAFIVLGSGQVRTRSKIILVAVPPVAAIVALTVLQQYTSDNRFNSIQQRLDWFGESIDIWLQSPWFGVGLRWWYTDRFASQFQPPNAELEILTTAGVVGLLGFVVLIVGTFRALGRLDRAYGTLAIAIVLNRVVQGQFDLFWSSVGSSLPFLVAGICLGAQAYRDDEAAQRALTPRDDGRKAGDVAAHRADRP